MDIDNIFDLVTKKKWNKIIEEIEKNPDLDINTPDDFNNYLITYAIISDVKDLIKLSIKRGATLDILDVDDRSILYTVIKYNYIDTLEYLLKINKNNEIIGISILDIRDKFNNIPLHYAIMIKNIKAVKLLLDYGSNPNIQDKNGNNSLHMAVFSRNLEIFKDVLKKNLNINQVNNTGESALHIACNLQEIEMIKILINDSDINLNIQDNEYEFTPLHYLINLNNTKLVKLLLDKGANPNIQDKFGNSLLHYSIIEKNINAFTEIIKNKSINVNIWNIYGKIAIHIVLEKQPLNLHKYLLDLIPLSNLNIQDSDGNTPLHLLLKDKLWYKFKDILQKKKLDIGIKNNDNKYPIDYLEKSEKKEFIDILINSYLYRLQNSFHQWNNDWEIKCSKKELNANIDECKKKIKEKIEKLINNPDSNNKCLTKSFPIKKGYICLDNFSSKKNIKNKKICSFTGTTLDILIGLIYLIKKNKNACCTVNKDFQINNELEKKYDELGIILNVRNEFLNFELIWIQNNLIFNTNFSNYFDKCLKNNNKRFIIIPLGIELKHGSHSNYIIYDKKTKELERFEPNGSTEPSGFNYNSFLLDNLIEQKFAGLVDDEIKYYAPKDFLPKVGFQIFDVYDKKKNIGDPGGFCASWSLWYVDMRLTYPDIDREKLVHILIKNIKQNNLSFRNVIRDFSFNIINIRDEILNEEGVDINDWINDEITENQFDNIITNIKNHF